MNWLLLNFLWYNTSNIDRWKCKLKIFTVEHLSFFSLLVFILLNLIKLLFHIEDHSFQIDVFFFELLKIWIFIFFVSNKLQNIVGLINLFQLEIIDLLNQLSFLFHFRWWEYTLQVIRSTWECLLRVLFDWLHNSTLMLKCEDEFNAVENFWF